MRRLTPFVPPILLVLLGLGVYSNSLSAPFLLDDLPALEDHTLAEIGSPWRVMQNSNRPVFKLSLALNLALGGRDVRGFHLTNVAIHVLAALTLFGVVRRTCLVGRPRERLRAAAPWLALAAAALWLVHPLQTQAVTYVYQRSESMMGLFYLLTLYCVIRGATGGARIAWGAAAVAACLVGMGSKEVMVTAPLMILLFDRVFLAGSFRGALRARWGLYLALGAICALLGGILVFSTLFGTGLTAGFGVSDVGPAEYALSQPGVILHYLRLCFWPRPLCLDYGWPPAEGLREILPALVAVAALVVVSVRGLLRGRWWGFAGVWFLLILAPTSSFVPIKDLAFEHRVYLSSAAVMVTVVVAAHHLLGRFGLPARGSLVLFAAALAALGTATRRRNEDYRSLVSLWQSVVEAAPENPRGHYNLALTLQMEGNIDEAEAHYRRTLELRPDHPKAHNNLGAVLFARGLHAEAIRHFVAAEPLMEDDAHLHVNWGMALLATGAHEEAAEHFRLTLAQSPDDLSAHLNLGVALSGLRRFDEAGVHFLRARELAPDDPRVHNDLGAFHISQGELEEAVACFRAALERDPDLVDAHNNLGYARYRQGRSDEALESFRAALGIDPDHGEALVNHAMVLLERGEGDEALGLLLRAVANRPGDARARTYLGIALCEKERYEEGMGELREALRLAPRNERARRALERATAARAGR